ncbi:MAG TPA: DinB family protein [Gemmatimonadaceae bacterium]
MNSQLAKLVDELNHAQARLERLGEQVPDDRWSKRSDEARWSVAECVAHLNLTSEAYIPRIRKAIEEARALPPAGSRSYSRDVIGWMFGKMVGPLPKIGKVRIGRVKTVPAFVPSGNFPKQQLLAEFKRLQDELIRLVRECDGLAIDEVKITSPFGERIRYNAYSALVLLPRHEERHLQQAELVWSR